MSCRENQYYVAFHLQKSVHSYSTNRSIQMAIFLVHFLTIRILTKECYEFIFSFVIFRYIKITLIMYISHFIISVVFTKRVNVLIFFVSRFRHFPNILPHEELPDPVHEDHTDQVEKDSSDLNDQVNLEEILWSITRSLKTGIYVHIHRASRAA